MEEGRERQKPLAGEVTQQGSEQSWILRSNGRRVLTSDNCALPAAHARARALSHQNVPRAEGKEIGKQAQ